MSDVLALPAPAGRAVCLRCGYGLRAERSRRRGYGGRCVTKVTKAARVLAASGNRSAEKAAELLLDGGLVRLPGHGGHAFRAVSSDGTTEYICSPDGCNCKAGLNGRLCYHCAAATILCA